MTNVKVYKILSLGWLSAGVNLLNHCTKKEEILNGKLNFLFSEYCNKATPRMISVNPFHASGLFLYPRKNFPFSESIERDQWYEIG